MLTNLYIGLGSIGTILSAVLINRLSPEIPGM